MDSGNDTLNDPEPFTAFTEITKKFLSMPFIASPPCSKDMEGTSIAFDFVARSLELTYS